MQAVRKERTGGFTLIELLVVVAIISLLMSILLPALGAAKEAAKTTVCLTNFKAMGSNMLSYTADAKDWIIPFEYQTRVTVSGSGDHRIPWFTLLVDAGYGTPARRKADASGWETFGNDQSVFRCPGGLDAHGGAIPASNTDPAGALANTGPGLGEDMKWNTNDDYVMHCWYGANAGTYITKFPMVRFPNDVGERVLHKTGELKQSSRVVGIFDGLWAHNHGSTSNPPGVNRINARHSRATQANVMFWDGHAGGIRIQDLPIGQLHDIKNTDAQKNNRKYFWSLEFIP